MTVGKIIKLLRTAEGRSQTALAKKIGVSRVYLSQVENDRKTPALSFLKAVSKTLRVPLALLFVGEAEADKRVVSELNNILRDILAARLASRRKLSA